MLNNGRLHAYINVTNDDSAIAGKFLSPIAKQLPDDPSLHPLERKLLELTEYIKQKNGHGDIQDASSAENETDKVLLPIDTVSDNTPNESTVQQRTDVPQSENEVISNVIVPSDVTLSNDVYADTSFEENVGVSFYDPDNTFDESNDQLQYNVSQSQIVTDEKAAAPIVKRRIRKRTKIQPKKPMARSTRPKTHVSNQSGINKHLQKPNASNVVQSIIESLQRALSRTESSDKSKTQQTNNGSKIIKPSKYEFFTKAWREKNLKKLAVFVSDDKKTCYEYTWHPTHMIYVCSACINYHNKHVSAKVIQNENGEEYIQLGPNDHKCNLKAFLP
uniref:Uncharacterized protein n=1 Tax=Panagrolaimus davidi TaxID=227884 RepID=A0A914QFV9_9BILA